MVFSGRLTALQRHATQLRPWQPRQQLLIPLYSLCSFSFTLRFCHELAYLTFWEGGRAEGKMEIFFSPEIMALSVRSGDRGGGRRAGDFSHSDPPIFLYKSHSISHGA